MERNFVTDSFSEMEYLKVTLLVKFCKGLFQTGCHFFLALILQNTIPTVDVPVTPKTCQLPPLCVLAVFIVRVHILQNKAQF